MSSRPATASFRARPGRRCSVARERTASYEAAAVGSSPPEDDTGPSLRQRVAAAASTLDEVLTAATDPSRAGGGELGALVDLHAAIETAQAAAIELTGRIEREGLAERGSGLSLDGLLAIQTRLTGGDRRTLANVADLLAGMPCLRGAFHAGVVGFAALRGIAAETRRLNRDQRAQLDRGFADQDRLGRMDADQLLDTVRQATDRLRPDLAERRAVRVAERRFLQIQPALDGALTFYGELDPEGGATLLAALDAAAGPPTPERDITAGALSADDDPADDGDSAAFSGQEARRSLGRRRADALTRIAEAYLAGTDADGTVRRARPSILVWADIRLFTGDDPAARAARLLWANHAGPVTLTPDAARRIASDARLRFIVHRDGDVLGVTHPTATIPDKVRVAVHARDHGCRFPGCHAPVAWCDLHHVIPREQGGPTVVANVVALCRRHHTAVTQGSWRLAMTADGTVTVRRGRRTATSDPPHRRRLLPPARAD